jgi:hypothetical protein
MKERRDREYIYTNDETGRPFPVIFFENLMGYAYNCRVCGIKPATHRVEIQNHLYEPQCSEYYCDSCLPPIPEKLD